MLECPGSKIIKSPTIEFIKCPYCQSEVEIFSDETTALCDRCGKEVTRAAALACIEWCQSARECVGEEKYQELMKAKEADQNGG
jgi:predicted amidophosphoribosyltransferase